MTRTLVVGAGVIGMLSARLLAAQGEQVTVLEVGQAAKQASWAGGGIVSPLYPWRYSPAVTALAKWSQDFYPTLGQQLHEQVAIDPEVHITGLYWLDLDDQDSALEWGQASGLLEVPIETVYAKVPVLGKGFSRAIHQPNVANVRNPRLGQALRAALLQATNVALHEHCEVLDVLVEQGRVVGVRTAEQVFTADRVVVAAGAWSGVLLSKLGLALPVEPVKGQMILYKAQADFLPSMIMAQGRYAIPRRDGHILIGSTLEYAGFDQTPTDQALCSLRESVQRLLPGLAEAQVIKQWAGLRPGSPEGIPYIGEIEQYSGLWLNCGHYRNGLVLAPASCQLLADLMTGKTPTIDPAPYAPQGRLQAL